MVVEEAQTNRLKEYGLNIKTKYQSDHQLLERNTDGSKNDNIKQGIILEKDYYKGVLLKKENIFDSRILYTYEFNESKEVKCGNCGATSNVDDNSGYCPYCHTNFNLEYTNKDLGSKYFYDLVTKDKSYIIKTYIFDLIVSFIITSVYIVNTSRTFYFFDMLKIAVGTILISLLLFYFFYYVDAMILLPGVRRKKERQNKRQQEFWSRLETKKLDKTTFYNNLLYELRELYYSDKYKDIIDFDIIDYVEFKDIEKDNKLYVDVSIEIRIVRYDNGKIKSKLDVKSYRMVWARQEETLNPGVNEIKCHNCNSSIKIRDKECKYCGTKINYYQQWYLVKELD